MNKRGLILGIVFVLVGIIFILVGFAYRYGIFDL